eukprot:287420_1
MREILIYVLRISIFESVSAFKNIWVFVRENIWFTRMRGTPTTNDKDNIKWTIVGSLCVTAYSSLTTLNHVAFKLSDLTITQVSLSRYSIQFILALFWWTLKKPTNPHVFRAFNQSNNSTPTIIQNWYGDQPYIWNIWTRGILYAVTQIIMLVSLYLLPIGDMLCLKFQRPLLVAYFGAFLLKEKLPDWYVLIPATIMSFTGITLLSQPSFLLKHIDPTYHYEPLNVYGIIMMIIATILYVPMALLIRTAKNAHFLQLEFATSGCMCFIAIPITLVVNRYLVHMDMIGYLDFEDWRFDLRSIGYMLFFGVCGFLQVSTLVVGYQMGDSTQVSWLEYITIPMGFIYQAFVFGDVPNKYETIGGVLVTTGCLLPLMKQVYSYFANQSRSEYTRVNVQDSESQYSTEDAHSDRELEK